MKRRPPKESLLLGPEDSKRLHKSPPSSKESFIFTIRKPHTKFITLSNVNVKEDSALSQERFVNISLEPENLEPISTLSVEAAKEYLKEISKEGEQIEPDTETETLMEIEDEDKENHRSCISDAKKLPRIPEEMQRTLYNLVEERFKTAEIARMFGISKSKVYYYHDKIKEQLASQGPRPKDKRILVTKAMVKELDSFMSQKAHATATLKMMRDHLAQLFDIPDDRLSLYSISRMLDKLGYSRKRAHNSEPNRNVGPSLEKRQQVAINILSTLKADVKVIYLDETGFNQGLMPLYGYSKKGHACFVESEANFQNYSVITAVTKEKILGFQIFKGGIITSDFGAFLANLVKYNPELLKERSKYAFYMDNAPIHHARSLKPFLKHFNVLYGAPYSPFLNPIEEIFSAWKYIFRNKFGSKKEISTRIFESALEIKEESLLLYFDHSLTFMKDCLNCKPIN